MKIDTRQDDHFFFDLGRQGKFFLSILIIFFVFFGVISEAFKRNIHKELIWLYTAFPKVDEWFFHEVLQIPGSNNWIYIGIIPILILFLTCFGLTYKEDIYLYGFKHSFWFVPFIIFTAIFWYNYINFWHPIDELTWDPISPFYLMFGTWNGWLTILLLFLINFAGAFAGWQVKEFIRIYIKKEETLLKKDQDENLKVKSKDIEVKLSGSN